MLDKHSLKGQDVVSLSLAYIAGVTYQTLLRVVLLVTGSLLKLC